MPYLKPENLRRAFDAAASAVEDTPVHTVAPAILASLADVFRCEWATYWEVHGHCLQPSAIWNGPDVEAHDLKSDTAGRRLSLSEGTAGHVWRSRKPVWSTHIIRDMCLPRSLGARRAGFEGGIWFAVRTSDTVYGVVELLAERLPKPTEEQLLAVEQFGFRLWEILEAKRPAKKPR